MQSGAPGVVTIVCPMPERTARSRTLFTAAVALSAALLFLVEPMTARGLLPLLGGSPTVWTTAMLFFQVVLLAGYLWAHFIATRRGGLALGVYIGVLVTGAAVVMFRGWKYPDPGGTDPRLWVLGALAVSVGPAFFALASAGPLLQRWFARAQTRTPAAPDEPHRSHRSRDPYTLYAASNAGSIAGLLGYPVLVEPNMGLQTQHRAWIAAYIIAGVLISACGVAALGGRASDRRSAGVEPMPDRPPRPITNRDRLLWIALAFIPSSFMLGTTAYLSTDVAAFPLLWVVPLTVYLATFIVAFAAPGRLPLGRLSRYGSLVLLFASAALLLHAKHPLPLVVLLHLSALAAAGLVCHARLAASRPEAERLTEFYVYVSLGGALGGVFNALAAPVLFDSLAEYPAIIALAALAGVRSDADSSWTRRWWLAPAAVGLSILAAWRLTPAMHAAGYAALLVLVGTPLVVAATAIARPAAFAPCLAALLIWGGPGEPAGAGQPESDAGSPRARIETERAVRTFFGLHRVELVRGPVPHRRLLNGTTIHGIALLDRPAFPTGYYHPLGPIGEVFKRMDNARAALDVAAVGLGIGSIAAYARPADRFTFFEIDPAVTRIAEDPALFRFLAEAEGDVVVRAADGRLGLAASAPGSFDLIILDAFSSDAIPVHLLTREAFEIYLGRLKPGGVIAVHLSNQYLDLPPVLGAIVRDLGVAARVRTDDAPPPVPTERDLMDASIWAVVARTEADLDHASSLGWPAAPENGSKAWTDDYADVFGVIRWDMPE